MGNNPTRREIKYGGIERMEQVTQLKRLLNVEETAHYLGMAPRSLYNAIAPKSKKPFPVKPKRIGKLVRFDIRDLDAFVEST
jgi:predicted DNA-binding transcriptional regulator AlpA